ncbi:MAG: DUF4231 domain-containing protein, partial [archaeon]|nr:DUF4231 domain-containing protein [archaeon]
GGAIALKSGALSLYKFKDNWIKYRTTSESLKHEKYLYLTKTHPYHKADAFNLLVKNSEYLISEENSQWLKRESKKDLDDDDSKAKKTS